MRRKETPNDSGWERTLLLRCLAKVLFNSVASRQEATQTVADGLKKQSNKIKKNHVGSNFNHNWIRNESATKFYRLLKLFMGTFLFRATWNKSNQHYEKLLLAHSRTPLTPRHRVRPSCTFTFKCDRSRRLMSTLICDVSYPPFFSLSQVLFSLFLHCALLLLLLPLSIPPI